MNTRKSHVNEDPVAASGEPILLPLALRARYHTGRAMSHGAGSVLVEAIELSTCRRVAVKLMKPVEDRGLRERLRRDGAILTGITHPHLVSVIEADLSGTQPYLVMEYLEGGSLQQRLRQSGRLGPQAATRIALDCLWALQACHDRDLIHGDLRPDDVMFTADGTPKLVGFGAPRRDCQPMQAAFDTFAMGLVLYEMLCGLPPFEPGRAPGLFEVGVKPSITPLLRRASRVPGKLAALVHDMLAVLPGERPITAADFTERLRGSLEEGRTPIQLHPKQHLGPEPARMSVVAASLLGVLLLAATTVSWGRGMHGSAAASEHTGHSPGSPESRSLAMVTHRTALLLPPTALVNGFRDR